MHVRRLRPDDADDYRTLMLGGYARYPEAFTSTVEERAALPLDWWRTRLDPSPEALQVVSGGFDGERLTGAAGLLFDTGTRTRHKAKLFGMFVHEDARRSRLGRLIVEDLLARAATRAGVRLVQLTVTQGNEAALKLYEGCGFEVFGVEPRAVSFERGLLAKLHMWRAV